MAGRYKPAGLETLTDMFILAGELKYDIGELDYNVSVLAEAMRGHVAENGADLTPGFNYLKEFLGDLKAAEEKFDKAQRMISDAFDDLHPE